MLFFVINAYYKFYGLLPVKCYGELLYIDRQWYFREITLQELTRVRYVLARKRFCCGYVPVTRSYICQRTPTYGNTSGI